MSDEPELDLRLLKLGNLDLDDGQDSDDEDWVKVGRGFLWAIALAMPFWVLVVWWFLG